MSPTEGHELPVVQTPGSPRAVVIAGPARALTPGPSGEPTISGHVPAGEVAGEALGSPPSPDHAPAEAADTPPGDSAGAQPRCDGWSDALGKCVKPAGHAGNHGTKDGETWRG